jgi:NADH:ubiquinone oxidoreductase subunit 4 (subunit M)
VFAIFVLAIGIWPEPLVRMLDAPVGQLVQTLGHSKL